MKVLEGVNLSLGYEGREMIKNINFKISEGDYVCIIGENGVGKSTLIKTILGQISPIKGSVIFDNGLSKGKLGYLPQGMPVEKDFPASVEEVVLSGCQARKGLRPFYSKREKLLAKFNLQRMGMSSVWKKCFRDLSGGQKQRVLLARALCATEKALLLDEPVASLDPKAMAEFYELINELNASGITIIMVTHDIEAALKYASHVLHIDENSFFGTKDEYLETNLGKCFILADKTTDSKNGGQV